MNNKFVWLAFLGPWCFCALCFLAILFDLPWSLISFSVMFLIFGLINSYFCYKAFKEMKASPESERETLTILFSLAVLETLAIFFLSWGMYSFTTVDFRGVFS